jgi:hypothetical protein
MKRLLLFAAVAFGLLVAYVDTRPNFDDAGITAFAVAIGCGLLGVIEPRYPWLWALAVGAWIPIFGIATALNYGSLIALAFALAGAYSGAACRRFLAPA